MISTGQFPWLEVLNSQLLLGRVRYALFDFDGTLSLIRRGWEQVMIAFMLECISPEVPPAPEIQSEVADYVDRSTGILTIKQMKWLEQTVRRYGLTPKVLSASEYKRQYNERLLSPVRQRITNLDGSLASRDAWMVAGARCFLQSLKERGVSLFLASGTDHTYVKEEAAVLDIAHFFGEHIYGAKGDAEDDSKEAVIQRILLKYRLEGGELLVVGDGPVEINLARRSGAVALGVAVDEFRGQGLNPRKRQRLMAAGADLLVTDFLYAEVLAGLLCG